MTKFFAKLRKIQWHLGIIFALICFGYIQYENKYSSHPRIINEMVSMQNGGDWSRVPLVTVSKSNGITITKYGREFLDYAPGNWKDDFVLDIVAYESVINNRGTAIDIVNACNKKDYKTLSKLRLISVRDTIQNRYRSYWQPVTKDECSSFIALMQYRRLIQDRSNAISSDWILFWLFILPISLGIIGILEKRLKE